MLEIEREGDRDRSRMPQYRTEGMCHMIISNFNKVWCFVVGMYDVVWHTLEKYN